MKTETKKTEIKASKPSVKKVGDTGATSEPEQFGGKENPKVDPASQSLNSSGSGVNDGSKSFNAED